MVELINGSILQEPTLLFGGSFPSSDPKLGISLYGPYSGVKLIKIGIIGDRDTIAQTAQLLRECRGVIEGPSKYPNWTPDFPGMSAQTPFGCDIDISEKWYQTVTSAELDRLDALNFVQEKISYSVDLFVKCLKNLHEREDAPEVVICSPPKRMMDACIPEEEYPQDHRPYRPSRQRTRHQSYQPYTVSSLLDFMPEFKQAREVLLLRMSVENFHHLLKARAMELGIPTQVILPYTLRTYAVGEGPKGQDKATFAWNLCVALIYKAGARPWRLADIPTGTCFVGISFYREKEAFGGQVGTSLAQVFTPEGEGLVLKGDRFEWPSRRSPRLSEDGSRKLMDKALALYHQHTGQDPSRIVVHKSSKYSEEEQAGLKTALKSVPKYDLIAIGTRQRKIRFFRSGYHPIIRGTTIALPDSSWLLYTKGYVPFLKVYPGPRVPRPLEILQHVGDSPFDVVSREILGLTKLNWNSADFSSLEPITLQFSRQVGTILKELPIGVTPQTKYLYYM